MKAIITVGISGSGKSTWASKQEGFVRIERDMIRRSILETDLNRKLEPGELWKLWSFRNENKVTENVERAIQAAANAQKDIIISDTNLNKGRRTALAEKLKAMGYEVETRFFKVELRDAINRDMRRADSVGEATIHSQWINWLKEGEDVTGVYQYVPDISLPKAVIVDIDGTIAHRCNRGMYDYQNAHNDHLDDVVSVCVRALHDAGNRIIIMTGRDEIGHDVLCDWLKKHNIAYDALYMRPLNDMRKDTSVKLELFKNVADKYNIIAAFDDRDSVVELWTSIGLKVIDVGNRFEHY